MADNVNPDSEKSSKAKAKEKAIGGSPRNTKPRLRKAMPTDRVTFIKQLDILRAAAATSGPERKLVSNDDIAKVVSIHVGSISNCNPFFLEAGLFTRHKHQNMPCEEVFTYAERYEWEPEKAAFKLAPVIRKTWFCLTLVPKLTFRSLSIDDAISFLSEEAGASKEYRSQLSILIDYMRVAGIVSVDGNIVSLIKVASEEVTHRNNSQSPSINVAADSSKPKVVQEEELNPFILGLLKKLPPPETDWPMAGRIKWLQTAANIFGLIYTETGGNEIEYIAIEKKQL
ncbi:MAG: hypothetical protein ACYCY7_01165 [Gallionella sp.]